MARLIHILSSVAWSGVERYALDICRSFADSGWSVTVYTRDARAVDTPFREAGIDLRHAPLMGLFDWASVALLSKHLKEEAQNTIIHTHTYRDAFTVLAARKLARRNDIKVIATRHHCRIARNTYIYKRIYRNLTAQIFVSRHVRTTFQTRWPNGKLPYDVNRTFILHNSLYTDPGTPTEPPVTGPIIAMYHGRLAPGKGLEDIIDALPALRGKRTRLWIVGIGDPDYTDRLRHRALESGVMDMIDWKGYTTDTNALIQKSHFGVMPSVIPEAFGLGNIEFMAAGRPIVATDNGAQPEYLTPRREALLVPPHNPEKLAQAMTELTSDPELRAKLGRNARREYQNRLSWAHFQKTLTAIYLELSQMK